MYDLFEEIKREVHQCLIYGPCNSRAVQKLQYELWQAEASQRAPQIKEPHTLSTILARSFWSKNISSSQTDLLDKLTDIAVQGFISGTGTCEAYAVIGAIFLKRKRLHKVEVSIESIHSDLSHTYLIVHTDEKDYIFDFWSDAVLIKGNWIEWNEAIAYEYRYHKDVYFSKLASNISDHTISIIYERMMSEANQHARQQNVNAINALTINYISSFKLHP